MNATQIDPEFARRYGPWAFIAGGSEGIGRSFAELLAAQGIHLLLVARNAAPLGSTAAELRAQFGVQVATAALDLTSTDVEARVDSLCAGKDVGLLVYRVPPRRSSTASTCRSSRGNPRATDPCGGRSSHAAER